MDIIFYYLSGWFFDYIAMDELFYNILASGIVLFAFFILGRKLYLIFFKANANSCDSGCGGCSTECDLKNLSQTKKSTKL